MASTPHQFEHSGCCGHALQAPHLRLREAEAVCAGRGERLTAQRRTVLGALIEAGRALGAYDLIDTLARATGKRVAPITIYRALDFLVAQGLVHRIESRNAFLACPAGHGPHAEAVFLICEACGKVCEAISPAVEIALAGLVAARGFAPQSRVIELVGRCADCHRPAGE